MNFPAAFISNIIHTFGKAEGEQLLHAMQDKPTVSVRLNPCKHKNKDRNMTAHLPFADSVPWCEDGYYLHQRPSFTDDPLFHLGHYYVQEASSMFLHTVLRQFVHQPVHMLDLCAAPGGKSTLARTVLPEGSILVSNDPMRKRANILLENIQKWGHPDNIVTCDYPATFATFGETFEVILCDAPCSGEGMFRKEEAAIAQWTEALVNECAVKQRDILTEAWKCLKPGGILIYSTCTLNTRENENNVAWMAEQFNADILPVDIQPEWHIVSSPVSGFPFPVYRFLPHRTKGEGLFMAVARKGEFCSDTHKQKKGKNTTATASLSSEQRTVIQSWLNDSSNFRLTSSGNDVLAIPRHYFSLYEQLTRRHHVLGAGVMAATLKGKALLPHQALALSTACNTQAFATCEMNDEQALSFLRTETLQLSNDIPTGIVLLLYKGVPLGFVKNIGNRANNLYPSEWRIRKLT